MTRITPPPTTPSELAARALVEAYKPDAVKHAALRSGVRAYGRAALFLGAISASTGVAAYGASQKGDSDRAWSWGAASAASGALASASGVVAGIHHLRAMWHNPRTPGASAAAPPPPPSAPTFPTGPRSAHEARIMAERASGVAPSGPRPVSVAPPPTPPAGTASMTVKALRAELSAAGVAGRSSLRTKAAMMEALERHRAAATPPAAPAAPTASPTGARPLGGPRGGGKLGMAMLALGAAGAAAAAFGGGSAHAATPGRGFIDGDAARRSERAPARPAPRPRPTAERRGPADRIAYERADGETVMRTRKQIRADRRRRR